MEHDFRFQKDSLKGICYSICGLGNSLYEKNFNKVAIDLNKSFSNLQATCVSPLYLCDENTINSKHSGLEGDVQYWQNEFFEKLDKYLSKEEVEPSLKKTFVKDFSQKPSRKVNDSICCNSNETSQDSCCKNNGVNEEKKKKHETPDLLYEDTTEDENSNNEEDGTYISEIDEELEDEDEQIGKKKKITKVSNSNGVIDMEDLGNLINKRKNKNKSQEPKEMLTPLLRKSLEKQGYKLIGTHSGVKLCRWTKSMLRGRGGCYKHTFYGIESHR
jgi:tRNA wybutosine-synthesizing protein 1